jgi:hypothetical protein
MKNLIKAFFLLLVFNLIYSTTIFAQSNSVEARFKDGDDALKKTVQMSFSQEYKKAKTCGISIVLAKFVVDTNGNVKDLVFLKSTSSPDIFKAILTTVIESTNGKWVPAKINGNAVDSKPFVLPLLYDLEAGCRTPDGQISNTTYEVLYNLLDFEDIKNSNQLDCTLLKPLIMFSQN